MPRAQRNGADSLEQEKKLDGKHCTKCNSTPIRAQCTNCARRGTTTAAINGTTNQLRTINSCTKRVNYMRNSFVVPFIMNRMAQKKSRRVLVTSSDKRCRYALGSNFDKSRPIRRHTLQQVYNNDILNILYRTRACLYDT